MCSAIRSLVRVSRVDPVALADLKSATIVRLARLHGLFAMQNEKLISLQGADFSVMIIAQRSTLAILISTTDLRKLGQQFIFPLFHGKTGNSS
jgi:hypothetical protein